MTETKTTSWYAALLGKERQACRVLAGKPDGKTHYENLHISGRLLNLTLEKGEGGGEL
jgi:hypothetical protein